MGDTIQIGDLVRLNDGRVATINDCAKFIGLYSTSYGVKYRHEFQPIKWDTDTIGN